MITNNGQENRFPEAAHRMLLALGEVTKAEACLVTEITEGVPSIAAAWQREESTPDAVKLPVDASGASGKHTAVISLNDGSAFGTLELVLPDDRPLKEPESILLDATAASLAEMVVSGRSMPPSPALSDGILSEISYEIRTPLNGILLMEELLRGTDLSEEQQKYVEVLGLSIKSLLTFVDTRLNPDSANRVDK